MARLASHHLTVRQACPAPGCSNASNNTSTIDHNNINTTSEQTSKQTINRTNKQTTKTSKRASQHACRQASKQASKPASQPASKQEASPPASTWKPYTLNLRKPHVQTLSKC
ncbi:unnamed protein product [Polarella glacialis]|uniref:Uncharacterized protein n=1 Tax=Polarella glacialis TaxID=89957 RepID=A0A813GU33_POLGL|nr:unnamed protein product [Polarella glacialis]